MWRHRSPFPQPSDLDWWAAKIARPAPCPQYALPASHLYDPYYYQQLPPWPFPRPPRPYETESRADGTGLIWGFPPAPPLCPPCPPPPCPPQPFVRPSWAQKALAHG